MVTATTTQNSTSTHKTEDVHHWTGGIFYFSWILLLNTEGSYYRAIFPLFPIAMINQNCVQVKVWCQSKNHHVCHFKDFFFNKKYLTGVIFGLSLISEGRMVLVNIVKGNRHLISLSYPLILWVSHCRYKNYKLPSIVSNPISEFIRNILTLV